MRARIRTSGFAFVQAELRHAADRVADGARQQMHRSAEIVVREAKINVPEDDELLKESIRIEKSYGNRNRLQIDIIAGGGIVDGPDGPRDLDSYAALVHENYWGAVANVNGPGKKTLEKMVKYPGRVGDKFLERALNEEEPKLVRRMISVVNRIIEVSKASKVSK